MDKEYLVFDTSRDSQLENTLNSWAAQGYEFCGIVNNPNVAGGKVGTSVIMRKMPEMDNTDVSEDLYSEPVPQQESNPKKISKGLAARFDESTKRLLREDGYDI